MASCRLSLAALHRTAATGCCGRGRLLNHPANRYPPVARAYCYSTHRVSDHGIQQQQQHVSWMHSRVAVRRFVSSLSSDEPTVLAPAKSEEDESNNSIDPMKDFVQSALRPSYCDIPHLSKHIMVGTNNTTTTTATATSMAGEENETEKGEDTNETNGKLINDVGCAVCLLGSGGGAPSTDRMTPATLIRMANRNMLVDVGEGTQRQLMYAAWPSSSISKLFITHMHGDHILGLPGLLLSAQQTQSQIKSQHKSLQIYGPPGLYNYIAMTLSLIHGHVSKVPITVYELVGGYQERGPNNRRHHRPNTPTASSSHQQHPTSLQKNVFLDWYPEFVIPNLTRVAIPRNLDGTWTLDHMGPDDAEHEEINSHDFTTEDGLYPTNLAKVLPLTRMAQRQSELDAMERKMRKKKRSHERGDGIYIGAAELQHVRGVQTFGYVMQEQVPLRNIDPDKALEEFGLEPSHKYKLLKMGQAVSRDDDPNVMVRPEQVWTPNQFRPRKIAILGDHCDISPAMAKLCMGADVLISEATLLPKNESEAFKRGHSSPGMAGRLARRLRAKVLCINHVSSSLDDQAETVDLVNVVKETNENQSQVVVGRDFLQLHIPKGGYEFPKPTSRPSTATLFGQTPSSPSEDHNAHQSNVASPNNTPPLVPLSSSDEEPVRIVPSTSTSQPTSSSEARSTLSQLKYLMTR